MMRSAAVSGEVKRKTAFFVVGWMMMMMLMKVVDVDGKLMMMKGLAC
jgi:hypothetical protein